LLNWLGKVLSQEMSVVTLQVRDLCSQLKKKIVKFRRHFFDVKKLDAKMMLFVSILINICRYDVVSL
jgi:hypothetical protein